MVRHYTFFVNFFSVEYYSRRKKKLVKQEVTHKRTETTRRRRQTQINNFSLSSQILRAKYLYILQTSQRHLLLLLLLIISLLLLKLCVNECMNEWWSNTKCTLTKKIGSSTFLSRSVHSLHSMHSTVRARAQVHFLESINFSLMIFLIGFYT